MKLWMLYQEKYAWHILYQPCIENVLVQALWTLVYTKLNVHLEGQSVMWCSGSVLRLMNVPSDLWFHWMPLAPTAPLESTVWFLVSGEESLNPTAPETLQYAATKNMLYYREPYMHIYMYTCSDVYTYVCVFVYMYVFLCMYVHCTYMYMGI